MGIIAIIMESLYSSVGNCLFWAGHKKKKKVFNILIDCLALYTPRYIFNTSYNNHIRTNYKRRRRKIGWTFFKFKRLIQYPNLFFPIDNCQMDIQIFDVIISFNHFYIKLMELLLKLKVSSFCLQYYWT